MNHEILQSIGEGLDVNCQRQMLFVVFKQGDFIA